MDIEYYQKLFAYNSWANERVWDCIVELNDEQFKYPSDYSIGSIHEQCVHQMGAEVLWLDRISGSNIIQSLARVADYPNRDDIARQWQIIRDDWMLYIDTLTEDDLNEEITFTSVTFGTKFTNKRWEGLMQVINHSTDHRAQILSMIHQVGGRTQEQDFIFFVWRN